MNTTKSSFSWDAFDLENTGKKTRKTPKKTPSTENNSTKLNEIFCNKSSFRKS